jgi:protein-disulfide isomerase
VHWPWALLSLATEVQKLFSNLATGVLVACALVTTGLVARRELFPAPAIAPAPATRSVPDWRRYASGQRIGPADAAVTVVAFSDYECPFCRATADRLRALRGKYPGELAVLYRQYPLPYHRDATPAARASLCAARQGRFEAYHEELFRLQDSLGTVPWTRIAQRAQVPDAGRFAVCMDGTATDAEIARDVLAGKTLGITATPTLLVNGDLLTGAPEGTLEEMVDRAVRAARRERSGS